VTDPSAQSSGRGSPALDAEEQEQSMPEIKVIRKGVTSSVREVPTDTTLAVLPLTFKRVGQEVASENEQPELVDSVEKAFEKLKPKYEFKERAGEEQAEFIADLEFNSITDFEPENILKAVPGKKNDLATLKSTVDLLYRLKERWELPAVKRAWEDPKQRKQILAALASLKEKIEKVAQGR
jgi:type VI secretion system protein ImpB